MYIYIVSERIYILAGSTLYVLRVYIYASSSRDTEQAPILVGAKN
jgi:hypothetical protein